MIGSFGGDLVVTAADVLHERVPGHYGPRGAVVFESADRSMSGFEPAVVTLDWVVGVLLDGVHRGRDQLVEDPRVGRCPVAGDLNRDRWGSEGLGEDPARGSVITMRAGQHVEDLTVLVDRAVQVGPAAGDFHLRLVDEPAVTRCTPRRVGCLDEFWRAPAVPTGRP